MKLAYKVTPSLKDNFLMFSLHLKVIRNHTSYWWWIKIYYLCILEGNCQEVDIWLGDRARQTNQTEDYNNNLGKIWWKIELGDSSDKERVIEKLCLCIPIILKECEYIYI